MRNADYYTIMESRIKYYSRKYDPENNYVVKDASPVIPGIEKPGKSIREKVMSGFSYIFSILF